MFLLFWEFWKEKPKSKSLKDKLISILNYNLHLKLQATTIRISIQKGLIVKDWSRCAKVKIKFFKGIFCFWTIFAEKQNSCHSSFGLGGNLRIYWNIKDKKNLKKNIKCKKRKFSYSTIEIKCLIIIEGKKEIF